MPTGAAEQRDWYVCGQTVVVFCGTLGGDGLYRFVASDGAHWEYCPVGTRLWDWYHQAAFFAHRAEPTSAARHSDLPPLPGDWPPASSITRHDETSPHAEPGGALWLAVERRGGILPIFIVLEEDTYETTFGDGCFRDFHGAYGDEQAALAAAATLATPHRTAHLRHAWLRLAERELTLVVAPEETTPFDQLTLAQVCEDLERRGEAERR
jgi:hypothetical protein